MSPNPRPLKRAKVWSAGLLTASTLVVGGIAVQLGEAHAQSTAAQTPGSTSSTNTSSSSTGNTSSSDTNSTGGSSAGTGDTSSSSGSGFTAVSPVSGSSRQAQSSSSGS